MDFLKISIYILFFRNSEMINFNEFVKFIGSFEYL